MPEAGLLQRITRLFQKAEPISTGPEQTTAAGAIAAEALTPWPLSSFTISTERQKVYDDVDEMDSTVEEVSTGLDTLADCAVNAEDGSQHSFTIEWGEEAPEKAKDMVVEMLKATKVQRKMFTVARATAKYGDVFLQPVVTRDGRLVRVMQMPVRSMHRHEDSSGLLLEPPKGWAFEQRAKATDQVIAQFYPWQIVHLRWNRPGEDKYGRTILYSCRLTWKKLKAMEEALVINWLTRAFARLLFKLQVPEDWSQQQKDEFIRKFQQKLLTKKVTGGGMIDDPMTVVRDIYLAVSHLSGGEGALVPSLDDVEVLDTSNTGFTHLTPLEYLRSKLLMSTRVPKAYLGLEKEVNAKATLEWEDRQFARVLRRIQSLLSEAVVQLVDLQLILQGLDPRAVEYTVMWPNPSRADELGKAQTQQHQAEADSRWMKAGAIDGEWIARNRLGMDDAEWQALQERMRAQAAEVAEVAEVEVTEEARRGPALLEESSDGDEDRLAEYHRATDRYQQELQELYLEWADTAAQRLAEAEDEADLYRILDDVLVYGLLLLKKKGWADLLAAFVLGFGAPVFRPDGLGLVKGEMDHNDHYLTTSLFQDVRGKLEGQIMAILLLLKGGQTEEAMDLIHTTLRSFRGRVGLYAGQYWHAVQEGIGERIKEIERERDRDIPVRRVLDDAARHCNTCPPKAREYPNWDTMVAMAGVPGDGQDECDGHCRCSVQALMDGQWVTI